MEAIDKDLAEGGLGQGHTIISPGVCKPIGSAAFFLLKTDSSVPARRHAMPVSEEGKTVKT
eukprot:15367030-Ditylum_brightwellii.AAC.1